MLTIQNLLSKKILQSSGNIYDELVGITEFGSYACAYSDIGGLTIPTSCKKINTCAFCHCQNLTNLFISNNVEYIGAFAFYGCENLIVEQHDLDLPNYCVIESNAFPNLSDRTENLYSIGEKVLIKDVTSDLSENTTSLAYGVGGKLISNSKLVIPDRILVISGGVSLESGSTITSMVIGSQVKYMGLSAIPTTITTLICRQPSGYYVQLPSKGGEGSGLSYNKNSRNMTIYTDNEYIKNYDWAGDNITATFYPLSQAPQ